MIWGYNCIKWSKLPFVARQKQKLPVKMMGMMGPSQGPVHEGSGFVVSSFFWYNFLIRCELFSSKIVSVLSVKNLENLRFKKVFISFPGSKLHFLKFFTYFYVQMHSLQTNTKISQERAFQIPQFFLPCLGYLIHNNNNSWYEVGITEPILGKR